MRSAGAGEASGEARPRSSTADLSAAGTEDVAHQPTFSREPGARPR